MKPQRKADIIAWGGVVLGVLLIAGGAAFFTLNKAAPVCTTEIIALAPPDNTELIIDALQQLVDLGIVPDREAALASFSGAQWVFDPDEDSELEYWIVFQGVGQTTAAEFNFHCPLNEENFPLDIEFEGVRGL